MINLLCTFRRDDHPIRLNWVFHLDLTWWWELFQSWDGLSCLLMLLGPLSLTSKSRQMPHAPWALERFSTANGFLVHGRLLNNLYLLLIRNCFRLLWQLICGVLSGLRGGSSSYVITSQWWLYCRQVHVPSEVQT